MPRRETMISIASIFLYCALAENLANTHILPQEPVPLLVRLHEMDWSQLSVEKAARVLPGFERIDLKLPEESQYRVHPCDGSTYLQKAKPADQRLEFEVVHSGGGNCVSHLRAYSAEIELDYAAAEAMHVKVIADLHASGSIGPDAGEYQWRSDDSRTRFTLTTAIDRQDATGKATLMFKLRHDPVSPDMVDGLPFRKGYFPPSCSCKE